MKTLVFMVRKGKRIAGLLTDDTPDKAPVVRLESGKTIRPSSSVIYPTTGLSAGEQELIERAKRGRSAPLLNQAGRQKRCAWCEEPMTQWDDWDSQGYWHCRGCRLKLDRKRYRWLIGLTRAGMGSGPLSQWLMTTDGERVLRGYCYERKHK